MKNLKSCKLCQTTAELRRSHIISESFYTDLYEDPHRFEVIVTGSNAKINYKQKGIRERLLCPKCEKLLGDKYEHYGAEAFRQLKAAARVNGTEFVHSVNYAPFKLFQLAQLWRMAISDDPLWQKVDLPISMENELRHMLLTGDPAKSDCFGVMMESIIADDGDLFDAFTPALTVKIGDYQFVLVSFAGFSWYFCAHKTVNDTRLSKYFVSEANSIRIGSRLLRDNHFIQKLADEIDPKFLIDEHSERTQV